MSKTSTFDEDGDDPTAVKWMIHFFYHAEYPKLAESPSDAVTLHPKMYAIADKYEVPQLKSLAKENFKEIAPENQCLEAFVDAVAFIYASASAADEDLKRIARIAIANRLGKFKECELEHFMTAVPDLAFDLVKTIRSEIVPIIR